MGQFHSLETTANGNLFNEAVQHDTTDFHCTILSFLFLFISTIFYYLFAVFAFFNSKLLVLNLNGLSCNFHVMAASLKWLSSAQAWCVVDLVLVERDLTNAIKHLNKLNFPHFCIILRSDCIKPVQIVPWWAFNGAAVLSIESYACHCGMTPLTNAISHIITNLWN